MTVEIIQMRRIVRARKAFLNVQMESASPPNGPVMMKTTAMIILMKRTVVILAPITMEVVIIFAKLSDLLMVHRLIEYADVDLDIIYALMDTLV